MNTLSFYPATHSPTHSSTHPLTYSLPPFLTHPLTHSLSHSLSYFPRRKAHWRLDHPIAHPLPHFFTHSLPSSLTHPPTYSPTFSGEKHIDALTIRSVCKVPLMNGLERISKSKSPVDLRFVLIEGTIFSTIHINILSNILVFCIQIRATCEPKAVIYDLTPTAFTCILPCM